MELLVKKTISCEGDLCGNCHHVDPLRYCRLFYKDLNPWPIYKRTKSCLEAEKTAKQLKGDPK